MNIATLIRDTPTRRETGSSTVELAIVFPILLLLFISAAELGRLFYTYTTLAKATKVGARYLSTSRDVTDPNKGPAEILKAQSLVVCGFTDCANRTPIVPGLTTANVNVCDSTSVPCVPPIANGPVRYFRVEIQNFTYQPGEFNLASRVGTANSAFYFALKPSTTMRYMPS